MQQSGILANTGRPSHLVVPQDAPLPKKQGGGRATRRGTGARAPRSGGRWARARPPGDKHGEASFPTHASPAAAAVPAQFVGAPPPPSAPRPRRGARATTTDPNAGAGHGEASFPTHALPPAAGAGDGHGEASFPTHVLPPAAVIPTQFVGAPPAFRASTAPGACATTTDPNPGAGDGHGGASFPTHAPPPAALVPAQFDNSSGCPRLPRLDRAGRARPSQTPAQGQGTGMGKCCFRPTRRRPLPSFPHNLTIRRGGPRLPRLDRAGCARDHHRPQHRGRGRAWGSLLSDPHAAARCPRSRTIRQFVGAAPAFCASTAPGARATITDPNAGAGDGHGEASFPTHTPPPAALVPAQFVGAPPPSRFDHAHHTTAEIVVRHPIPQQILQLLLLVVVHVVHIAVPPPPTHSSSWTTLRFPCPLLSSVIEIFTRAAMSQYMLACFSAYTTAPSDRLNVQLAPPPPSRSHSSHSTVPTGISLARCSHPCARASNETPTRRTSSSTSLTSSSHLLVRA
ncbi:hypothetical protein K438DRAFT_1996674 [Mycena galopus ATCC 62051]|nr:hypothetical protein K438DRAFT_1996674 [Mycena galopus ATCC 62051]